MKKLSVLLLALVMALSFTAVAEEKGAFRVGVLSDTISNKSVALTQQHLAEHTTQAISQKYSHGFVAIKYDSLSALLLDLKAGNIDSFGINIETAKYIVARNDDLTYNEDESLQQVAYSMVTKEENTEFFNLLNNAIIEMKKDGTLAQLIEKELTASIESDPQPVEIPVIPGAKTYRVAVTGDIPPMDYISADGKPAGFNIALLSEIARRANVNIETTVIESGAKGIALMSGRVDAYFWMASGRCVAHPDFKADEAAEGSMATEDYIVLDMVPLLLKK